MKQALRFICFLVITSATAQTTKYSNEFLNIGVDARAFGMANAVVAGTNDVNSGYWNPAGLIHLEDKQISLMHGSYFANIAQYDYLGFATPVDHYSALGVSLIRFGVDNIMNTTQLIDEQGNIDYDRISFFSAADYALIFSYTRTPKTNDHLSYGGNAKIIHRMIGDFASSWGFGFDVAVQYQRNNWFLGVMVRDITTTYNTWQIDENIFDSVSDQIPEQDVPETTEITLPKAQFGIGRKFEFRYDYTLLAEVDLNMRFAQTNDIISTQQFSVTPAVGFEFGFRNMVFARAGVGNFQKELQLDGTDNVSFQPNIGLGFRYKSIQVDYALTDIGDQSAAIYSNIFSVKLDWKLFR